MPDRNWSKGGKFDSRLGFRPISAFIAASDAAGDLNYSTAKAIFPGQVRDAVSCASA
jgi:hypothetical protein